MMFCKVHDRHYAESSDERLECPLCVEDRMSKAAALDAKLDRLAEFQVAVSIGYGRQPPMVVDSAGKDWIDLPEFERRSVWLHYVKAGPQG